MKKIVLAAALSASLVLGACTKDNNVVAPTSSTGSSSLTKAAQQLQVSTSQQGEIEEMFYLGEDMSSVLSPEACSQMSDFIASGGASIMDHRGLDPRRYLDIDAMLYYRASLKANTDITDQQKSDIQAAIEASNKARLAIAADTTLDATAKASALQAEHDKLMALIKGSGGQAGILTADQVSKTDALLAQIELQRQQMHDQMLTLRIQAQIAFWNRILTLTDAQKTSISDLLKKQDADIQAARLQYKDAPDQFRAAVLAIQKATNDAIRALLDDTQKALWDKLLAGFGAGGGGYHGGGMHGGMEGGMHGRHG